MSKSFKFQGETDIVSGIIQLISCVEIAYTAFSYIKIQDESVKHLTWSHSGSLLAKPSLALKNLCINVTVAGVCIHYAYEWCY